MNADGQAVAAWDWSDSIRAVRFVPGSGWGTPDFLEDAEPEARQPRVSIGAAGDAVAIWIQADDPQSDGFSVRAAHLPAGDDWTEAVLLESSDRPADPDGAPQAVVDAEGDAVAVWAQSDGTRQHIWSSRLEPAEAEPTPAARN
jgi:hypothetical protein